MSITFGELLEHNGYKIGASKIVRKKNFRELVAETPRERLEEIVKSSSNFNQVAKAIDGKHSAAPYNVAILIEAFEHWGIDSSNLSMIRRPGAGKARLDDGMLPEEVLDQFFGENPPIKSSWATLRRLINRHNLLPLQCSECGISSKWNGKPLTMQIDHMNGNRDDNRIENLRRLCPNCHTQTDTYCSKNIRVAHISALIDANKV